MSHIITTTSRAAIEDRAAVLERLATRGKTPAQRHLLDQPHLSETEEARAWCVNADQIIAALDKPGAWYVVTEGIDGCTNPYWIDDDQWWPTAGEDGRTEAKEAGPHGRLRRFAKREEAQRFAEQHREAAEQWRDERDEIRRLDSR